MINNTPIREKPIPRTQRTRYRNFNQIPDKTNRAKQIRRDDTIKNVSIGLQDIDKAIVYFLKEVIKPKVLENNVLIDVPIRYGDSELWKAIRRDGFVRDKKGHAIAPLINIRRTNVTKNSDIPIDKSDRNLVHQYPLKWTQRNKYDRFSLINNLKPMYEMYNVVVPDYVTLTYECYIWTSYTPQMNKIIEDLQYWEGHYWGDESRFKFKTKYDSIDQNVEISTDKGRVVRSNFTMEIFGFLVPEVANDQITTQKEYTIQQIIIGEETEIDLVKGKPLPSKYVSTGKPVQAISTSTGTTLTDAIIAYLASDKYKINTSVTSDDGSGRTIAHFTNTVQSTVPSGLSLLGVEDYLFFCNGQYMEHDALTIVQDGTTFRLYAEIALLGYMFDSSDEIIAWGKFQ